MKDNLDNLNIVLVNGLLPKLESTSTDTGTKIKV